MHSNLQPTPDAERTVGSLHRDCSTARTTSPRDWHWSLRSLEIHAGRLCVECGERVPADGPMCEECELEMLYE